MLAAVRNDISLMHVNEIVVFEPVSSLGLAQALIDGDARINSYRVLALHRQVVSKPHLAELPLPEAADEIVFIELIARTVGRSG